MSSRDLLVSVAAGELGVKEATGRNDGLRVEEYLQYSGLKKGDPWCASYLSWVFKQAGFGRPCTGWSPALFPLSRRTTDPLPGDVYGIYFKSLGRIGHCGLLERRHGSWVFGLEGNTNVDGGREGNGVYRKVRHVRTIDCFANWVKG